jgi:hypothetical protein
MPKLLLFAPCEKVIIADDGTTSMITILERINISIPASTELVEDAAIAMRWDVFALWQKEPQDEGKTYQARFTLTTPKGKEQAEGSITLEFAPDKEKFRAVFKSTGFPIADGVCVLRLLLREAYIEEWLEMAQYPLLVTRQTSEEGQ